MGLLKKAEQKTSEAVEPQQVTASDLENSDPDIRRRAAQILRGNDIIPALVSALEKEEKHAVRVAIFNAMREIGGVDVANALVPYLGSEDTEIRNAAVAVMKSLGKAMDEIMPDLLKHGDADIRIMAIDILQDLGHSAAPEWLGEVLKQDTHQNVVGAAIDRMVEIGTPDQCNALRAAAERFQDDPFIAFASAEAIKAIESGQQK